MSSQWLAAQRKFLSLTLSTPTPAPIPTPTPTPTSQTFTASADFSGIQGTRGWSYLDSNGTPLVYDAAGGEWTGAEAYLTVWADDMHPGDSLDVVRRWTAPQSGTISISGTVSDREPNGGDGVVAVIVHNGAELWRSSIEDNGNTTGKNFSVSTAVTAGDTIDFIVNRNGDNSYDSTVFDPTIVLASASAAERKR